MKTHILVAADGREGSLGALHLARALARRDGCRVSVLGAIEPFTFYGVGSEYAPPPVVDGIERQQTLLLREAIAAQLRAVGEEAESWPIHIHTGPISPTIVRAATEFGATLILLGMGRRRPIERWLGGETTLSVIQLAHVPVLAVQPAARELPRRVLVAVDFSAFSMAAARAALPLVQPAADFHLVHVGWPALLTTPAESLDEWAKTYEKGALARLEEFGRELAAQHDVRVHTRLLSGDAPQALLEAAEEVEADLIAAGSHGHAFFARIVLGSVSTRLLRRARGSVLIAPPHLPPAELERAAATASQRQPAAAPTGNPAAAA